MSGHHQPENSSSSDKRGVGTLVGSRLDHLPMGGISQRQSKSMTGSLDLLSASRSLTGERHFTALAGEASACCWQFEHFFFFFFFLCACVCAGDACWVWKRYDCERYPPEKGRNGREGFEELTIMAMTMTTVINSNNRCIRVNKNRRFSAK